MKKNLSIFLVCAMLVAMVALPGSADGLIGNLETEVQIRGLSELNVRTLISRYFSQREAYLQGTADTINVVVAPMVADEIAHKEILAEANAVLTDSTAVIGSVLLDDYVAEVTATETATFVIDGEIVQESIIHAICVYANNAGYLGVGSDGYVETATGFASASYIDAEAVGLADFVPAGAPECIVGVAMNEIGTTPGADGTTIYGRWYNEAANKTGYEKADWCAMFVSWCAHHASVPTSVIPLTAWVPDFADFYLPRGRYYPSASGGGSYTPQPGDLIFIGYNDSDTFYSPGHVGIVSAVYDGVVYYVDGNATYYINGVGVKRVSYRSKSLTATDILAYGNPNYTSYTHTTLLWDCDEYEHWAPCEACGIEVREVHNFIETDAGNMGCDICGYIDYYYYY